MKWKDHREQVDSSSGTLSKKVKYLVEGNSAQPAQFSGFIEVKEVCERPGTLLFRGKTSQESVHAARGCKVPGPFGATIGT
jgi:hypothetical protein